METTYDVAAVARLRSQALLSALSRLDVALVDARHAITDAGHAVTDMQRLTGLLTADARDIAALAGLPPQRDADVKDSEDADGER